ncbi:MAG: hypothetical protein SchgKO_25100 [Schleiferiaceae bacterium]
MRHYLLYLLLLLLYPTFLSSQELERNYRHYPFSHSSAIEIMDSHIYMNMSKAEYFDFDYHKQKLYKLDMALNLVDSIDFSNYDVYLGNWTETTIEDIITVGPDTLGILLRQIYDDSTNSSLYVTIKSHVILVDGDLNLISSQSIGGLDTNFYSVKLNTFGPHLYIMGYEKDNTILKPSGQLYKLDKSNSLIDTVEILGVADTNDLFAPQQIIPFGSKRLITSDLFFGAIDNLSVFDEDLNFEKSIELTPSVHGVPDVWGIDIGDVGKLGDTAFIMVSPGITPRQNPDRPWENEYYHVMVSIMDTSFTQFSIDTLPYNGFDYALPEYYEDPFILPENVDMSNTDSISIGIPGSFIESGDKYDMEPNQLYLYSYNASQKALNWHRILDRQSSIDSRVQSAYVGNGQTVFVFNEFRWSVEFAAHQTVVILLMNANGDILSEKEISTELPRVSIFPNPASEKIQLDYSGELNSYAIIDINGRTLSKNPFDGREYSISIEELPAGTYFLQLFKKDGLYAVERFVVN